MPSMWSALMGDELPIMSKPRLQPPFVMCLPRSIHASYQLIRSVSLFMTNSLSGPTHNFYARFCAIYSPTPSNLLQNKPPSLSVPISLKITLKDSIHLRVCASACRMRDLAYLPTNFHNSSANLYDSNAITPA